MKKILMLAAIVISIALVIAAAAILYDQFGADYKPQQLSTEPKETDSAEKMKAPDFTVYDGEGNEVHCMTS